MLAADTDTVLNIMRRKARKCVGLNVNLKYPTRKDSLVFCDVADKSKSNAFYNIRALIVVLLKISEVKINVCAADINETIVNVQHKCISSLVII